MHSEARRLESSHPQLRDYFDAIEGRQASPARTSGATIARRLTSHALRVSLRTGATRAFAPIMRRRAAARVADHGSCYLHLGCGPNQIAGWVNVDVLGAKADLHWDLRRPLPFEHNSVDAVFSEHMLEHFSFSSALALLQDCFRVLKPGGLIRIGVPDFGKYAKAYADDRELLRSLRPGRPTPLLAAVEVIYGDGHRSAWDGETLAFFLDASGFAGTSERAWGDSSLKGTPDLPDRRLETVYVEAVKPEREARPAPAELGGQRTR